NLLPVRESELRYNAVSGRPEFEDPAPCLEPQSILNPSYVDLCADPMTGQSCLFVELVSVFRVLEPIGPRCYRASAVLILLPPNSLLDAAPLLTGLQAFERVLQAI